MRQQLTLEEIQQIGSRPEEVAGLAHQVITSAGDDSWFDAKGMLELVRNCTDLYVAAHVLDEPMAENTLNLFKEPRVLNKNTPEVSDTVILVAGGFHTKGLIEAFRKADVSYDVLTPNITADYTREDEQRYADRMAGKPVSLKGFLAAGSTAGASTDTEIRTPQSKTANDLLLAVRKPKLILRTPMSYRCSVKIPIGLKFIKSLIAP